MQVAEVCIQCDRVARQDDARVVLAAQEINQLLESVEVQQQQFSGCATAGGVAGATEDRDQENCSSNNIIIIILFSTERKLRYLSPIK